MLWVTPTWTKTKTIREAREIVSNERYLDYGIELRVVEKDPKGWAPIFGLDRVRTLEKHFFGGVWDKQRMCWVGASERPVIWIASKEQAQLVLHRDLPPQVIVEGGEGAGKTRGVLAPWICLQLLSAAGHAIEMGCTAPTGTRLQTLELALREHMPPHWYKYHANRRLFTLHCGPRARLVSAAQYTEESGSPIQSYDWFAHAGDEYQDHFERDGDITTRGRRAFFGDYRRMNTATVKDSSGYRAFKEQWLSSDLRTIVKLPGPTNPVVPAAHWKRTKSILSPREYKRRVDAEDTPPELATYYGYDRQHTLRKLPRDAVDVTGQVLALHYGKPYAALACTDPGELRFATEICKAYQLPGQLRHSWWVVAEVITSQASATQHAIRLHERMHQLGIHREQFPPKEFVMVADPASEFVRTDQPHITVYRELRNAGVTVHSASPRFHKVPQEPRIAMVNNLLCAADGTRRLFVLLDERGICQAPMLRKSFEHSERDAAGHAETERKSKRYKETDYSDAGCALGYGMWPMERVRTIAHERRAA